MSAQEYTLLTDSNSQRLGSRTCNLLHWAVVIYQPAEQPARCCSTSCQHDKLENIGLTQTLHLVQAHGRTGCVTKECLHLSLPKDDIAKAFHPLPLLARSLDWGPARDACNTTEAWAMT